MKKYSLLLLAVAVTASLTDALVCLRRPDFDGAALAGAVAVQQLQREGRPATSREILLRAHQVWANLP